MTAWDTVQSIELIQYSAVHLHAYCTSHYSSGLRNIFSLFYILFCYLIYYFISQHQRNEAGISQAMEYIAFQHCMEYVNSCGIS